MASPSLICRCSPICAHRSPLLPLPLPPPPPRHYFSSFLVCTSGLLLLLSVSCCLHPGLRYMYAGNALIGEHYSSRLSDAEDIFAILDPLSSNSHETAMFPLRRLDSFQLDLKRCRRQENYPVEIPAQTRGRPHPCCCGHQVRYTLWTV